MRKIAVAATIVADEKRRKEERRILKNLQELSQNYKYLYKK